MVISVEIGFKPNIYTKFDNIDLFYENKLSNYKEYYTFIKQKYKHKPED